MRRTVALLVLPLVLAACSADGDAEEATLWLYHLERQVHGPAPTGQLTCGPPQQRCPLYEGAPAEVLRYQRRGEPAVGGTDFVAGSARAAGSTVLVELSPEGAQRFASFTRFLAEQGRADGEPHHFVAAVGGEIVTFGSVDPDAQPEGLPDAPGLQLALPSPTEAERIEGMLRRR